MEIVFLVNYRECSIIFGSYGDVKEEYWSRKTLAKRLNSFKYIINSAKSAIVDVAETVIIDE